MMRVLFEVVLAAIPLVFSGSGITVADDSETIEHLELVRLFPRMAKDNQWNDVCTSVSPTLVQSHGQSFILTISTAGKLVALDPNSGETVWHVSLPAPDGQEPYVVATPAQVGRKLIVAYQTTLEDLDARQDHWVVIVDLEERALDEDFVPLQLTGQIATPDGSAVVNFLPSNALSRSAVAHVPKSSGGLGYVYIAFGNAADVQPWHGWLFEVDLDSWRKRGTKSAISGKLVTTLENSCPSGSKSRCGGGIWTSAGPYVVLSESRPELLVPTGNGQFNITRGGYGNTVMRLGQGLEFDPGCHPDRCSGVNLTNPSEACFRSCANLFVPRLPGNDESHPFPLGSCDTESFNQCLADTDYDLGANAPVRVDLKRGPPVIVQPGKEGGLYLFDANHLGRLYDRRQIVDVCGSKEDECLVPFAGVIITQPAVVWLKEIPVIIVPTFVPDSTHPAGLVALRIVVEDGLPHFEPHWRAPTRSSKEARVRFRYYNTRPSVTYISPVKEPIVWVADLHWGPHSHLIYGVRVEDGKILTRVKAQGLVQRFTKPLYYSGNLYFASCFNNGDMVEAFRVKAGQ
jgi:hypothetical protein